MLFSGAIHHCYDRLPVVVFNIIVVVVVVVVVVLVFVVVWPVSFNCNILLCVAKHVGNVSNAFVIGQKSALH